LATLKQTHEKKGDRWVAKPHEGPSGPRSKQPTTAAKRVEGRSTVNKGELAQAVARKQ
jgi:hypothetical protein